MVYRTVVAGSCLLVVGCASNQIQNSQITDPPISRAPLSAAQHCDITPAFDWMRQQKIIYTQSPGDEWRDCSGNFLRLSSRIATLCPDVTMAAPAGIAQYIHGGNNKRPGLADARTTRGLAKWYDNKNLFTPVYYDGDDKDAAPPVLVSFRNKIKPGTVLWFSPGAPRKAQGKANLYKEAGGMINHMGTVVGVEKDSDGNVVGWDMYHGQNARKHNGVTSHLWEKSGRSKPVPQGGYGQQRIVGFVEYIIPEQTINN